MRIRHKKTNWEGTVDDEGWKVLQRAGTSKNYEVIDKSDSPKVENVQLPEEVMKFQGRLQEQKEQEKNQQPAAQQKTGPKKGRTGEQPAGKAEQK